MGINLGVFSDDYLIRGKGHEWGDVINFDGPSSGPVREFFVTNGRYWIEEFISMVFGSTPRTPFATNPKNTLLAQSVRAAREAAGSRSIILIAENDLQEAKMTRPPSEGGDGLDGMWNDDFHHGAIVAMTGNTSAITVIIQETRRSSFPLAKYGFLYQGQAFSWRQNLARDSDAGCSAEDFVCFIENHDQIANTGLGERSRFQTSRGRYRAMTALLLLGPWTPLLFPRRRIRRIQSFSIFRQT